MHKANHNSSRVDIAANVQESFSPAHPGEEEIPQSSSAAPDSGAYRNLAEGVAS